MRDEVKAAWLYFIPHPSSLIPFLSADAGRVAAVAELHHLGLGLGRLAVGAAIVLALIRGTVTNAVRALLRVRLVSHPSSLPTLTTTSSNGRGTACGTSRPSAR